MFDPERAVVEAFTSGSFQVPPYPEIALRLNTLLSRPDYAVADAIELLGADPALAARVLGVANSAAMRGKAQEITTLTQAVTRLGAAQLSRIALASGVADAACAHGGLREIKFLVWRQSLTCAFVAQQLASHRQLEGEQAFLVGLLQGFGSTIVIEALEHVIGGQAELLSRTQSGWLQIVARQQRSAALYLAKQWGLPDALSEALAGKVTPGDATAERLQDLIALSRRVVSALERSPGLARDELAELIPDEEELDALAELLPDLPDTIAALGGSNRAPRGPVEKLVLKSSTGRQPDVRSLFSVLVHKAKESITYQGSVVDRQTLVLRGSQPLQENWLARAELRCEPKPLELWIRVTRSVVDGKQVLIEAAPFALNGPALKHWSLLADHALRKS